MFGISEYIDYHLSPEPPVTVSPNLPQILSPANSLNLTAQLGSPISLHCIVRNLQSKTVSTAKKNTFEEEVVWDIPRRVKKDVQSDLTTIKFWNPWVLFSRKNRQLDSKLFGKKTLCKHHLSRETVESKNRLQVRFDRKKKPTRRCRWLKNSNFLSRQLMHVYANSLKICSGLSYSKFTWCSHGT